MTTTLIATLADQERAWIEELKGKTIKGVRPEHKSGPVPTVRLQFTDGTNYDLEVRRGVFFESCLINTLRRAQPIHRVVMVQTGDDTMLELRTKTFPLLQLCAVNKELATGEFPFVLSPRTDA